MSFLDRQWRTSGYSVVGTAPGARTYRWAGQEDSDDGTQLSPDERRDIAEKLAALLNADGEAALTPNQAKALAAIQEFISVNGRPPVPREIADAIGISTVGADYIFDSLTRKGLLVRPPRGERRPRPISLPEQVTR